MPGSVTFVPEYLSEEWIADLDAAARSSEALREATESVRLAVQHEITGGPQGDVAFHVVADHGTLRAAPGEATEPTVTFIQSYDTAVAVAKGELSAQAAFMMGAIRVRGDLPQLVTQHDAFANLEDVFATVRGQTSF